MGRSLRDTSKVSWSHKSINNIFLRCKSKYKLDLNLIFLVLVSTINLLSSTRKSPSFILQPPARSLQLPKELKPRRTCHTFQVSRTFHLKILSMSIQLALKRLRAKFKLTRKPLKKKALLKRMADQRQKS